MAKIAMIEWIVFEALTDHPETRGDNFLLYNEVLRHYIDVNLPLVEVFKNHKELGIPSLETITRCRRRLQTLHPDLRDKEADEIRRREEEDFFAYAREDFARSQG